MSGLDELAGAELAQLVPAATALVWAVRTGNAAELDTALVEATAHAGWAGVRALVVLLAAMVPDDETPSRLLGWLPDPDGYLRLREQGVSRVDAIDTIRLNTSM